MHALLLTSSGPQSGPPLRALDSLLVGFWLPEASSEEPAAHAGLCVVAQLWLVGCRLHARAQQCTGTTALAAARGAREEHLDCVFCQAGRVLLEKRLCLGDLAVWQEYLLYQHMYTHVYYFGVRGWLLLGFGYHRFELVLRLFKRVVGAYSELPGIGALQLYAYPTMQAGAVSRNSGKIIHMLFAAQAFNARGKG